MDMIPQKWPKGEGGKEANGNPQPDTWRKLRRRHFARPVARPLFDDSFPAEYLDKAYDLLDLWQGKLVRNQLRQRYYNGKNVLKDFGISIPPQLLHVETVVGWPQKAVDAMAVRCRFDGFTAASREVQRELDDLVERSRLRVKYRQAAQSALIHSCCFATVALDADGQPRIDLHSAETAAARWDDALGRIAYGLCIRAFKDGAPVEFDLHTGDAVVRCWDTGLAYWDYEVQPISMGRPTMEALSYRPTYGRPFGQSRITRAVMSLTDSAVRVALGGDVAYQFSVSPQKYLLGADADAFANTTKWEAYIGNIFAVGRDDANGIPEFGQLTQGSMAQTSEYFRLLAARFSGETNVPISNLGVIHDQPASAEAIYAAEEPLVIECEDFNDQARDMLRTVALMALAGKHDTPLGELADELRDFTPDFRNPAMPSVVSQTDAMVKIASAVPGFAGTDVFFEQIGFPEDMRRKAQAEIAQNIGMQAIAAVIDDDG